MTIAAHSTTCASAGSRLVVSRSMTTKALTPRPFPRATSCRPPGAWGRGAYPCSPRAHAPGRSARRRYGTRRPSSRKGASRVACTRSSVFAEDHASRRSRRGCDRRASGARPRELHQVEEWIRPPRAGDPVDLHPPGRVVGEHHELVAGERIPGLTPGLIELAG